MKLVWLLSKVESMRKLMKTSHQLFDFTHHRQYITATELRPASCYSVLQLLQVMLSERASDKLKIHANFMGKSALSYKSLSCMIIYLHSCWSAEKILQVWHLVCHICVPPTAFLGLLITWRSCFTKKSWYWITLVAPLTGISLLYLSMSLLSLNLLHICHAAPADCSLYFSQHRTQEVPARMLSDWSDHGDFMNHIVCLYIWHPWQDNLDREAISM